MGIWLGIGVVIVGIFVFLCFCVVQAEKLHKRGN